MNNLSVISSFLQSPEEGALAIIAGIEGPSYRPLGAIMAITSEKQWTGSLSSGCIEADIALQAMEAIARDELRLVRYGIGSPYVDIRLPCGGGLEIVILPRPERKILKIIHDRLKARKSGTLKIDLVTGGLELVPENVTRRDKDELYICFEPDIQFHIFGTGPEVEAFSALTFSNHFPTLLLSPDNKIIAHAKNRSCPAQHLTHPSCPQNLNIDKWTAIVLFFHGHDWEPQILIGALNSPAFYIGAQGSDRARQQRAINLEELGVRQEQIERLRGPIGLIPSVRDSRTLAVSVLAEILNIFMKNTK